MIIRNIKEFLNSINDEKILCIDFGKKKIGLAISNILQSIATPIDTLIRDKNFYKKIKIIIQEYEVGAILVGLPLNENGSLNKISQFIVDITKNMDFNLLDSKINIPIHFWDENYSSFEAEILTKGILKKKKKIDKYAAKIILDDFLRENKPNEKQN